ncbi:hypothetical protein, partial [Brucella intermedia]|uniref:hypothetical protein n=1 Tax=Brucella intermedia TaxID=94625 RepID=UPI00224B7D01
QRASLAISGETLDSFHLPLAEADLLRFLCQQPSQKKSAMPNDPLEFTLLSDRNHLFYKQFVTCATCMNWQP